MKITYVITRAEPGGAQSHVLALMAAVRDRAEVELIVGEAGVLCDQVRNLGLKVHVIPCLTPQISPRNDLRAITVIRNLFAETRPDLIHAHSSKAGLIARFAARSLGIPSVFTAHGWAFTRGTSIMRKAIAIPSEFVAGRLGSAVIAVSRNDYLLARKFRICKQADLFMIHNGIAHSPGVADPGTSPPIIISVARFAPPKQPVLIAKALSGCTADFRLWFVGDGPLRRDVEQEVNRLGLTRRTVFWGTRSDVASLLTKAQLFVLSSSYEGLPISILEAMATGLPVVTSDVGGIRELVVQGKNGIYVPPGNVTAMTEALARFIRDPDLRIQAGRFGRILAASHFSNESMISKTTSVYRYVTGAQDICHESISEQIHTPPADGDAELAFDIRKPA